MRLTIEPTAQLTEVESGFSRVWIGTTEGGARCLVFVSRIAVHESQSSADFDRELFEQLPPATTLSLKDVLLEEDAVNTRRELEAAHRLTAQLQEQVDELRALNGAKP